MRRYWPIILFVALSAAAILIVRVFILAEDDRASNATSTPSSGPFVRNIIVWCPPVTQGQDLCSRHIEDTLRRIPLTPEQRAAGLDLTIRASSAIESWRRGRGTCLAPTVVTAADAPCQLAEPVMSVEELRGILASAGFTDAIVRIARSTDAAPVGSLLYAVPVIEACLVGYVTQQSNVELVGRLPGGACLPS